MNKKTVKDIDLKGKRVLMRVDFNVPMQDGKVTDDKRIKASLPTIKYVLEQGASLLLASHLGRPKAGPDPEFSLKAASEVLAGHLGIPVKMAPDCVGPEVEAMVKDLKPGEVIMLENTRFHKGEEKNDLELAKQMASLADVYVNDAFGSAHRAHSSSVDLPFTMVLGKEASTFAKIVAWYDNEWGYSCRTADLAAMMAKSL